MAFPFKELKGVDIVGFMENRGVSFKQSGGKFRACCPLPGHTEKTPSFIVSPELGSFYCHGKCKAGGDAVDFEQKIKGIDRVAAAKNVAAWAGVTLPEYGPVDPRAAEAAKKKKAFHESLFAAVASAAEYYAKALNKTDEEHPGPAKARAYIQARGFGASVKSFLLGYAPGTEGFFSWMTEKGFSREILLSAGLLAEGDSGKYQTFRNRLMIPIRDARGRIVSFTGRVLDADVQPKYLNGPTTPIFKKSEILYAFSEAEKDIRETGQALIVEGHLDAIALHQTGYFTNTVACQGSAFTLEHAAALVKIGCIDAVLIPDGDGNMNLNKVLDSALAAALPIRVVTLPPNSELPNGTKIKWDPDSFIKAPEYGEECLSTQVNEALDLMLHIIDAVAKKTPEGVTQIVVIGDCVRPIIERLDAPRQEWLIPRVAKLFNLSPKIVREACGLAFPSKKKKHLAGVAPLPIAPGNADCDSPNGPPDSPELSENLGKPPPEASLLSDVGNAHRIVHYFGKDLLYSYEEKQWFYWNKKTWVEDYDGRVTSSAMTLYKLIRAEAARPGLNGRKEAIETWSVLSQRGDSIDRAVSKARSQLSVRRPEWDTHDHLLCCGNGVVDLRTGKLLPHNRSFKTRIMTNVPMDPDCKTPIWDRFLSDVQKDLDVKEFIQIAVGYSSTGSVAEQAFFFNFGTGALTKNGANGKSTFIDTIAKALGGFSVNLPVETFLWKPSAQSGTTPNLAKLVNRRFVVMSEPEQNAKLAEGPLKRATGDDVISINPKYEKAFDLTVKFKMWLSANYRPKITGTDDAIWRRITPIAWPVHIPEEERDIHMKQKLTAELPGILAWIVAGAVRWYNDGRLIRPRAVIEAAESERARQDVVGAFIKDCCDLETTDPLFDRAAVLYASYIAWTDGSANPITLTSFGLQMSGRGYRSERSSKLRGQTIRFGLRVRDEWRVEPRSKDH